MKVSWVLIADLVSLFLDWICSKYVQYKLKND